MSEAPSIVDRERELAMCAAFLDVAARRFAVLELEGEPGIGKTTLWQDILERARDRGLLVLACHRVETEARMALSALADLLEPFGADDLAALPGPQRRALESALLRTEPDGSPPPPRTLATAVRSLLTNLGVRQPVLVAIDDAQWLDPESRNILAFVIRRLDNERVSWLFTRRSATPALDLDHLAPDGRVKRIELGPLPLSAIHHVIERRLEQPLTRPMLVQAHRASGGNPLYAIEIARELMRSGRSAGGVTTVPRSLRDLLTARLRRLPPASREALLVASALAEPRTDMVDHHVLGPAEEADVVRIDVEGRIRFTHPLLAAAVYDGASTSDQRRVHIELARRVSDPEERARHLALATTKPDEDVARMLERGAQHARSRGAWESAAELAERARALTPRERRDRAHARGLAAAEYHVHAGDRSRGRALLEAILAEPLSRSHRADGLRLLAEICQHDESFIESVRWFEEALAHADDPSLRLAIEIGLAFTASYINPMDFEPSRRHARRALDLAESIGDKGAIASALAYSTMYEYLCGGGVNWENVARSLELEDKDRVCPLQTRPSVVDAFLRLFVGHHAEARERLAALCAEAVANGDESDVAFVLLWFSWLETRSGNLDRAVDLAEQAASVARLTGSESLAAWARLQRAYAGANRGEVEATRRACAEGLDDMHRFGNRMLALWIGASAALLELSAGDPEAAWGACEHLVAAIDGPGIAEPVPLFFLPDAVEALIALGRLDRAQATLDALRARARALDRTWALAVEARCRALLLAARGHLDLAMAEIERALAENERIELPLELGRTLLAKGMIERRQRRRSHAKASFERALDVFERIGAQLWAERARAELGRLGLQRLGRGELTESERRVAVLTAQGLTRREVAAALFISPKTVDATLVRVYRKLGVGSRAELGARMASSGTAMGNRPM